MIGTGGTPEDIEVDSGELRVGWWVQEAWGWWRWVDGGELGGVPLQTSLSLFSGTVLHSLSLFLLFPLSLCISCWLPCS